MISKRQAWGLGVVATVLAIIASTIALWPMVGWKTPDGHKADLVEAEADHVDAQQPILNAITALSVKMDVNSDKWECDEDEEDLVEQLQEQAVRPTVQNEVDIEETRARISDRKCTRFKD